ncbi:MAG TPA: DUF2993 domain-containing protein [Candidatus Xenobia bacterium]|jgi:hypothetical protein
MRSFVLAAPLAGIALMTMVAGCGQGGVGSSLGGQILTPTVEGSIQSALPQVLGPGQYTVTVSGLDTTGHANEVDITGTNMTPPGAPTIASMNAQFLDVNYSQSQNTITHVGRVNMNLTVTAADMTTWLVTDKGIPDTVVTFSSPDQLGLTGSPTVPTLGPVSVVIQGHVVPSGAQVSYVLDTVQVSGVSETDPTILTDISNLYNPLVDLSGIPAHPTITAVQAVSGAMTIVATGFFP